MLLNRVKFIPLSMLECSEVFAAFMIYKFIYNISSPITDWNIILKRTIQSSQLQEATLYLWPLVCQRNRQTDGPRIKIGYPKDWRFLLKRVRVISLSFYVDASPKDALPRLHSIISRCPSENRRILILRVKPIGLIEWRKARLESLLVSHLFQKKN